MAYDTPYKARPNSGSLFLEDKKNANAPDFKGSISLDAELITSLYLRVKTGQPANIEVAGWRRSSQKTGKSFLSVTAQQPLKERSQGVPQPSQQAPLPDDDDLPF